MSAPQNESGSYSLPIVGVYSSDAPTLRDAFALAAMQAVPMPESQLHDVVAVYDRIASHAYKMADAMIRARKGGAA